jgi:ubiquinol-cytochrome c reductase cytochrome b subunit
VWLAIFVVSFVGLGYLGAVPADPIKTILSQIFTVLYFLFFLLMPIYTSIETCKQPPKRVTGGSH